MSPAAAPPIVAIVGRPNVGKSTLFNRYAGANRVLVHDTPGLTRDRIVQAVEAAGRRILVVDTAGLDPDAEAGLPAAVQAQARVAVAEADAVLFVVDGRAGLLPEDERIAAELRRTDKPVALAINKLDHPKHAERVLDFHRLGLEPTAGISAAHGHGAWDLLETLVERLPEPAPVEEEAGIRLAVIGRPNVGKSSLVNALLGEERVVVSNEPGTTRDAVDSVLVRDDQRYVLVDTAGLRRPGRRHSQPERGGALMALRSLERADVALVVIDAGEGVTDQDVHVAGLARSRGRPVLVLANQWDRVGGEDGPDPTRVRDEIARRLRFMADAPVQAVSARTGSQLERIFPWVARLHTRAGREIPTAELNRWLEDAVGRHQPALGEKGTRRRPIRFFYATQTGVHPPTFTLFCTDPGAVKPGYRRYLENRLRERFDLAGVPLRLRLRGRRNPA
jgi:GTP-binding protein